MTVDTVLSRLMGGFFTRLPGPRAKHSTFSVLAHEMKDAGFTDKMKTKLDDLT